MKTGVIKSFVEEQGYGFIQTDKSSVYFNVKDLSYKILDELKIGQLVTFDEIPTPKGNKAVNVSIADKNMFKYIFPEETIILREHRKLPPGYVILSNSNFEIFANLRDPTNLEALFTKYLSILGANAAIDVKLTKTTGSEPGTGSGTHYYTIHRFSGKVARIAKISSEGHSISKLQDLDTHIQNLINRDSERMEQNERVNSRLYLSLAVFIFMTIYTIFSPSITVFGIEIIVAIFLFSLIKSSQRKILPVLNLKEFVRKSHSS